MEKDKLFLFLKNSIGWIFFIRTISTCELQKKYRGSWEENIKNEIKNFFLFLDHFSSDDELLSLACSRESNQREGHPNVMAYGFLRRNQLLRVANNRHPCLRFAYLNILFRYPYN